MASPGNLSGARGSRCSLLDQSGRRSISHRTARRPGLAPGRLAPGLPDLGSGPALDLVVLGPPDPGPHPAPDLARGLGPAGPGLVPADLVLGRSRPDRRLAGS